MAFTIDQFEVISAFSATIVVTLQTIGRKNAGLGRLNASVVAQEQAIRARSTIVRGDGAGETGRIARWARSIDQNKGISARGTVFLSGSIAGQARFVANRAIVGVVGVWVGRGKVKAFSTITGW